MEEEQKAPTTGTRGGFVIKIAIHIDLRYNILCKRCTYTVGG